MCVASCVRHRVRGVIGVIPVMFFSICFEWIRSFFFGIRNSQCVNTIFVREQVFITNTNLRREFSLQYYNPSSEVFITNSHRVPFFTTIFTINCKTTIPKSNNNMWFKQLVLLSIASSSAAFSHHRHVSGIATRARLGLDSPSNTQLPVLIYGWDGEVEEDDTTSGSSTSVLDFSLPAAAPNALAESISQDTEKTASLARLAAAFSPPERALRVEDIKDVHVVNVTNKHIEIVAMICDGTSEGCVSLFVPVDFKQECLPVGYEIDDSSLESCVRSNIDDLDVDAELMLLQNRANQSQDGMGGLFSMYGDSPTSPDYFSP